MLPLHRFGDGSLGSWQGAWLHIDDEAITSKIRDLHAVRYSSSLPSVIRR
jgi:hypothetical protein